ncbi:hypothetical protein M5E84_04290 [[Ruminococcus] torques]|nr:hypothetical protein M5E84_04290 [[Ruminococcus] torques]
MKCSSSKNLLKKIGFLNAGSLTVFLFLAMLVSPDIVFTGAADGLLLWFNTIFPTLFPFMFITAILLKSGGLNIIANVLGKPLGKIFSVSAAGAFSVIAGFLCGYPMGAKVTADLVCTKRSNALRLLICYLSVIIQVLFLSLILLYTRFCVIGRYLFQRLSY